MSTQARCLRCCRINRTFGSACMLRASSAYSWGVMRIRRSNRRRENAQEQAATTAAAATNGRIACCAAANNRAG